MPHRFFPRPWTLVLLLPLACKDPETAAAQKQAVQVQNSLSQGREALTKGQYARAISELQKAANAAPESVEPLLLLAKAHQGAGNPGAAILTLKQAEGLIPGTDPVIQKQLSDLYMGEGQIPQAISTLVSLREEGKLSNEDILSLARLQARQGNPDAAFTTLERILRENPDDAPTKTVEAEILLMKGEELLAANLMDRVLQGSPSFTPARLLRARFFLMSGVNDMAEADLQSVPPEDADSTDVVAMKARVLMALGRPAEAEGALRKLLEDDAENAEATAWLAEIVCAQGRASEAQQLVDRALHLRPRFARALYVRGRVLEEQSDARGAEDSYRFALKAEPAFPPALSRMWRLHLKAGRKPEAQEVLERLTSLNEATVEEKAALANLYAQFETQLPRGKKLIDEALKREPHNPDYLRIQKAIDKATPKKKKAGPTGPVIIRGRR
ncbi:tetratricopeptide repeat protein [Corallococcus sp. AB004]|uniref:tetratricopeptide repeat protein n=1 Tax=Corallococcus exiguus TaxID=83462 RepID=UPI000EA094AC|nr:tetratricopeptide repeat protein [Corallococcus exiguus]NPC72972.1 tetratricopeptide repeat protein [Corallococcus exiguus]RKI45827.1 tetratricopeptide repeat protein [Corallococcus sp. AB004]